ncbi:CDP-diacylglycerol--serine O-phosphatidyltransferase [bacterium]|nr:CDP-diacylglycerol--serine O-phosphatidyltransferase [bacterium]
MRKVIILPNLFTSASLFCGMCAIFHVYGNNGAGNVPSHHIEQACLLILLSAFLDVSDGFIARLTNSQSFFGLNLDSLADLVAFGVAPALLAYHRLHGAVPTGAATTVCAFYVICGALRLARFNVQATREESKKFSGIPIPGAALAVISIIWVLNDMPWLESRLEPFHLRIEPILAPLMVVLGTLMVSKVPYLGLKSFKLSNRQPFEILVTVVVVASLLFLLKERLNVLLMAGIWGYIGIGVIAAATRLAIGHRGRANAVVHDSRSHS